MLVFVNGSHTHTHIRTFPKTNTHLNTVLFRQHYSVSH